MAFTAAPARMKAPSMSPKCFFDLTVNVTPSLSESARQGSVPRPTSTKPKPGLPSPVFRPLRDREREFVLVFAGRHRRAWSPRAGSHSANLPLQGYQGRNPWLVRVTPILLPHRDDSNQPRTEKSIACPSFLSCLFHETPLYRVAVLIVGRTRVYILGGRF